MNVGLISNTYSGITGGQGALQSARTNADKAKFSELIEWTQAAVSAWELGVREPEMSVIFDIADTLKVPVSSLIPIEMSGMEDDVAQKIIDVLYQNPQLFAAFDKIKYFDEKQMTVVLSVIEAISRETKEV